MLDRSVLAKTGLAIAAVAAFSLYALAQRQAGRSADDQNVAGEFDYYTLVMSWSPTHCSSDDGRDDPMQCDRRDGRRYAFVLHGLWPQYERGYPERCFTRRRPFVPQPIIDGMLDIMPSPKLVIHEYRAHGTCSGLDPAGYYALSRKLFDTIEIPARYKNPFEAQFVDPDQLVDEIVGLNPELTPEMMAVTCGGPGNRLKDVRICFTRDGAPRACGSNEEQRRLCRADRVNLPPVRSTARDEAGPTRRGGGGAPLPGPLDRGDR